MIESIYFFIFENENGFRLMTDEGFELSETFQRSERSFLKTQLKRLIT